MTFGHGFYACVITVTILLMGFCMGRFSAMPGRHPIAVPIAVTCSMDYPKPERTIYNDVFHKL